MTIGRRERWEESGERRGERSPEGLGGSRQCSVRFGFGLGSRERWRRRPETWAREEKNRANLEALPGQLAAIEVHEHVAERLHVVAARLLDAEMRVDRRVTRRSCQVLIFSRRAH